MACALAASWRKNRMKPDLHMHTTSSDGVLSPRELVRKAAEQGVTLCEADFTTAAPTALDDDALDDVAGGKFAPHQSYFRNLLFTYLPGGQPPAATPLPVRPGQTPAAQTMEIRLGVPGPGKPVSL